MTTSGTPTTVSETPTTKAALKKLILDALAMAYTSSSCKDSIATGNRYQSVALGDEHTTGFRSDRDVFLDQIDFREKRVLDLGSNLGEISRAARARGAAVVDGFEYDPFFIEIANAINAYNGVTRVSSFRRDITDASVYDEHYDIVIAFSVFVYLQDLFQTLCEITDGVLVLETHRLERNLESTYLNPIGRFFPHHAILGNSDWGTGSDPDKVGERAVIAFAKSDEALRTSLSWLSGPSKQPSSERRPLTEPDIREIDVRQTAWYDRFFEKFAFDSPEGLLATVEGMQFDVDALARNGDLAEDLAGWTYWLAYLKGAIECARGGSAGPGNVYYDLLGRHWRNDPARASDIEDPSRLSALVRRRFDDFELFRTNRDAPLAIEPLHIVITDGPPKPSTTRDVKRVYQFGREVPVETTTLDGYHRLFLARLFGHDRVPCDFVAERDAVPDPTA